MERLAKTEKLNELFSVYQKLFTEKQIAYFNMYYEMDYSYQEIADHFKVSRNAIFDQLKRVEENLYLYEESLKLIENKNKRINLINKFIETKDIKFIEELKRMDE
ncbi:MAG TPA: hypothetical protein GX012_04810 [Acholeplasma sp.]|nr:hypothetical protein [Acholeplasma sp.]